MRLTHKHDTIGQNYNNYNSADSFYRHPRKFLCVNVLIIDEEPSANSAVPNTLNTYRMKIERDQTAVLQNKRTVGVWNVRFINHAQTTEGIEVYYCGFQVNVRQAQPATLSVTNSGPKFFITPTMEGCTLAVGSISASNTFLVTHYNISACSLQEIESTERDIGYKLEEIDKDYIRAKYTGDHSLSYRTQMGRINQKNAAEEDHGNQVQLVDPDNYRKIRAPKPANINNNKQSGLKAIQNSLGTQSTTFGVRNREKWRFYTHRYIVVQETPKIVRLDGTYQEISGLRFKSVDQDEEQWVQD